MTFSPLGSSGIRGDYPYFRGVWRLVILVLLAAAFVPLLTVGGGMYLYGTSVVKQETVRSLKKEVTNHRNAIDDFLAERILDLRLLAENTPLDTLTRPASLSAHFSSLQSLIPCFEDLGIIDSDGRHLAYVGPYDLLSKNYRAEPWFQAVMKQNVFISDVFLGFRGKPHFIIAVKQQSDLRTWILRATVNADFFQRRIAHSAGPHTKDAFLLSADGFYQTQPRLSGQLMDRSFLDVPEKFPGVRIIENNEDVFLMVWQNATPWINVVQIREDQIYQLFHKARTLGIFALLLSAILIVLSVTLTTHYLVSRLEAKKQSIEKLDQHLRRCSYLASSMELSFGFFREIRDALANMDVTARLVLEKSTGPGTEAVSQGIQEIHAEADRIRSEIDKFTRCIRPAEPLIVRVDLNEMLENLLAFLESELKFRCVRVEKKLHTALPAIQSDPSRLHQVFQNLLLNAIQAIGKDGSIYLESWLDHEMVVVQITDTGPGIPEENLGKIFDPLFSTRREGTGLGLSVSRSVLEKLGGNISVISKPGVGAVFQVRLPQKFSVAHSPEGKNAS